MREWKDLSLDEKKILEAMQMQGITPDELIDRMRNSGKMSEESIKALKKALDDVKHLLIH